jgi:hypothetical protein
MEETEQSCEHPIRLGAKRAGVVSKSVAASSNEDSIDSCQERAKGATKWKGAAIGSKE